jgi:DNA-binding NtrC family response regulator
VILMTAYSAGELVERAERAGAVRILSKPVALPDLLALVSEQAAASDVPVLVVDDDETFLRSLCDNLRAAGVRAHPASSLAEAVAQLERRDFEVVLLDLRLDGFSGTDSALAVKRASPDVLLILFSGHPEMLRETRAALPEHWVAASLTKPFEPAALIEVLEALHAG